MELTDDRSKLDAVLTSDKSLCLLLGTGASDAGKVHGCMETRTWGNLLWQRWFLVPEALLKDTDPAWFEGDKDYVFLGRHTKAVTSSGKCKDGLMFSDGECNFIQFQLQFAQADLR